MKLKSILSLKESLTHGHNGGSLGGRERGEEEEEGEAEGEEEEEGEEEGEEEEEGEAESG